MTDRWAAADLLAAPIMAVRRNRAIVAEAAGLADPGGKLAASKRQAGGEPAASGPPDGWLDRLMACDGWSDRKRRLSPEEQLSALVATELRRLTLEGSLRAVWTCHRVEHAGGDAIGRMIQRLQRVLGVVPGAPDWWFQWGSGAGLVELKIERPADLLDLRKDGTARAPTRTYMRPVQRDFREWAVSNGVRHEVCRSVSEVTAALRRWGRLL